MDLREILFLKNKITENNVFDRIDRNGQQLGKLKIKISGTLLAVTDRLHPVEDTATGKTGCVPE